MQANPKTMITCSALLMLTLPLGIAVQNAIFWIVFVTLVYLTWRNQQGMLLKTALLENSNKWLVGGFLLYTVAGVIATLLNDQMGASPLPFLLNHLGHFALVLFAAFYLHREDWRRHRGLDSAVSVMFFLWGLIVWSQFVWKWQLVGSHLTWGLPRGRGFYSHPLSLAYAVLLWVPWSLHRLSQKPKEILRWLEFAGVSLAIFFSLSRVVILCYGGVLLVMGFIAFKGKMRWLAPAFLGLILGFSLLRGSFLKERFEVTGREGDHQSSYRDDRLAFWHVATRMIQDKPLLGHGVGLSEAYRKPYFEALGERNMTKHYGSHNTFLEAVVETGVIGGIGFLISWFCLGVIFFRKRQESMGRTALLTWVFFSLASLTQNSFQDSVVRHNLFILACWWIVGQAKKGSCRIKNPVIKSKD